jgi:hypothetical protein
VWINRKEIVKKNRQNVGSQNFGPGIKEQILQERKPENILIFLSLQG